MEIHAREADRWLRQAEADLEATKWNLEGAHHAPACFWAQQSAAKALRAFLFLHSEDARETRSVADLLDRAITYDERFKDLVAAVSRLDIYYKTARFPDALPGGIPAEVMTERDAKEALNYASNILEVVEEARKSYLPETL